MKEIDFSVMQKAVEAWDSFTISCRMANVRYKKALKKRMKRANRLRSEDGRYKK